MKEIKRHTKDPIAVYRNEAFDSGFYRYFKGIGNNNISKILNNKERNVKFETISYRELNSWEKAGLLTVEREGREWRRFSIIDAIWVKLIKELREFGVTWKQLKIAKKSLEFESEKCGVAMPMLEFYTAFIIAQKMPVLLLVFKDGITLPVSFTQYKVAKQTGGMPNHMQISLNDIIQGMVPELDLKPVHKPEMPLDFDEVELLAFLRMDHYEKVEIQYSSGKMEVLQGMQRMEINARIGDVIRQHKYQKIEVVVNDGKSVSIIRTVKKKINTKG